MLKEAASLVVVSWLHLLLPQTAWLHLPHLLTTTPRPPGAGHVQPSASLSMGESKRFTTNWLPVPQGYFYVEAHKEAHVKEALRGLRMIYQSKPPMLVCGRRWWPALVAGAGGQRW